MTITSFLEMSKIEGRKGPSPTVNVNLINFSSPELNTNRRAYSTGRIYSKVHSSIKRFTQLLL